MKSRETTIYSKNDANGVRTDVMTPAQRSRCMSRIKGRNTGPELCLRRALWIKGYRYRLKVSLLGQPDLVFVGKRLVIFVDGCFWHGCPDHGVRPKSNQQFWHTKIRGNIERDARVTASLEAQGWRVLRVWEHDIEAD